MRRRSSVILLTAGAITAALSGCAPAAPGSDAAAPSGEPVRGGTLVFGDVQPITTVQTQRANNYSVANLISQLEDRLTFIDPDSGELGGWIAEEFAANEANTEFTFAIRDGVTFSDGSPLDAEAVERNLEFLGHGDADQGIPANTGFSGFDRAEVTGDAEVTAYFSSPNYNFLTVTSTATAGLVSPETLELDIADQSDVEQIVGSGPFVFESQIPEQEIRLVARDDYAWAPEASPNQGRAYVDEVVFTVLAEVGLRAGAVTSGQVDAARGIQPADEEPLRSAGFQVVPTRTTDLTVNFAGFRATDTVLEDVRVRQALQIGFDREAVAENVLGESYAPATSLLPSGAPGYVDLSNELAYDPEGAASLLDAAGWQPGADGIRVKDGERLELSLAASNQSVVFRPAFEFIAEQWRAIGVQLDNRAGDNTFSTAAGTDPSVELVGTRLFMNGGIGPIYREATNVWTYSSDEEFNAAYDAELAATDEAAWNAAREAQQRRIVLENPRVLVLWEETQVQALGRGVHLEFTGGDTPLLQRAWVAG